MNYPHVTAVFRRLYQRTLTFMDNDDLQKINHQMVLNRWTTKKAIYLSYSMSIDFWGLPLWSMDAAAAKAELLEMEAQGLAIKDGRGFYSLTSAGYDAINPEMHI